MDRFVRFGKAALLLAVLALLLIAAVNCSCDDTSESKVHWLHDWDEASSKAQDENKPIMIDFYTDWCPPCKQLDSNTYSDDDLSAYLNENFVCLKSNMEKDNLYQNYSNMQFVPTIIFASPEGTEFGRMVGYKPPDQYYSATQQILSEWEP